MPLVWSLPTSRGDRLAIVRLGDGVCLRVADELVLLRDPSTGQKLDQVAVIWVGTNFFRQERPATPDIWIRTPGPDTDSRSLPPCFDSSSTKTTSRFRGFANSSSDRLPIRGSRSDFR